VKDLSKEEVIHTTLLGLARRIGPGGQLPTVRKLCEMLATSRSTMDRVLRTLEAERIVNCIQGSGIYVSPHINQRKIGIIFPGNITDPLRFSQFWRLLHSSAMRLAAKNGDELKTYFGCPAHNEDDLEPSSYSLLDDISSRRLTGLITVGIGKRDQFEWLKSYGLPIVSFGHSDMSDASLCFNDFANIQIGLRAFRDAGCKKVALLYLGGSSDSQDEKDPTSKAFEKACKTLGLIYSPELQWTPNLLSQWETLEDASASIIRQKWNSPDDKPDGIFFLDDTMAHGGIIAFLESGIKLGSEVQVAALTHTGASLLRPFSKYLYRVEIDPTEIIEKMFSMLGKLLQGMTLADKHLLIEAKLLPPSK
jgi:DNA-binding LacI/PurR family transcriptional regulator